jgi:cellobiose phosphorylase
VWSASYSPCKEAGQAYRVIHGIGYTRFIQNISRIRSVWTITVDPETQTEVWSLHIENRLNKTRKLAVAPYLEWCLGKGAEHHRQIHQCFMQTRINDSQIVATRNMCEMPGPGGHWNRTYPFTAFVASSQRTVAWQFSKKRFLGYRGMMNMPVFDFQNSHNSAAGSNDAIASMKMEFNLKPGKTHDIYFMLGITKNHNSRKTIRRLRKKLLSANGFNNVERRVRDFWQQAFNGFDIETPDRSLNILVNQWLKYQVFSSRIFGRSGYYVQGGIYGYREIQDLLAVIPLEPKLARKRLLLYAENQYADLRVPHYFDLLSGEKGPALWSDDMLWLPFISMKYLLETNDHSILRENVPFIDSSRRQSFYLHCVRGIERVLHNLGKNGLPLIKEGDWNDGLSAVGVEGKGESVWLGHFLAGILRDFIPLTEKLKDKKRTIAYKRALHKLKRSLNTKGWDGNWFKRAKCDNGTWIGTSKNKAGRIFLNVQVWAIIHDVISDKNKLKKIIKALDKHIYTEEGPVLFSPPYTTPDSRIGYLTRYNPGVRENGGVYTHAANWALQAEAILGRKSMVEQIYKKMSPVLRSYEDPERYQSEPYVTAGNIEYKPSKAAGKGAWSWYTSGGAWFYYVLTEWMLGIRPRYDGLEVCPVVPDAWKGFKAHRIFRNKELSIEVIQKKNATKRFFIDGKPIDNDYIPVSKLRRKKHSIKVIIPIG